MHVVAEHEFIKNEQGELALLLDVLSFEPAVEPVLLVSLEENIAYLRRSEGDVHEITSINPDVIDLVRSANNVMVVEMTGKKVTHSYDALTGILEDDDEDDEDDLDDGEDEEETPASDK
jgi:hypothetical protein